MSELVREMQERIDEHKEALGDGACVSLSNGLKQLYATIDTFQATVPTLLEDRAGLKTESEPEPPERAQSERSSFTRPASSAVSLAERCLAGKRREGSLFGLRATRGHGGFVQ